MRRSWRQAQLQIYMALVCASVISPSIVAAQSNLKKVRLGVAATSVGFLPIYTAYHRGFYRDEGIDLEIILMSLAALTMLFSRARSITAPGSPGLL
jgi:ABC-type nitrate/sulfonate/bicarbonate transport system substrate-binding protein